MYNVIYTLVVPGEYVTDIMSISVEKIGVCY